MDRMKPGTSQRALSGIIWHVSLRANMNEEQKLPARQCTASAKSTGKRCVRAPIAGSTVCRVHGGAAPQVRAKARERLLALVDPALCELDKLLRKAKMEPVRMAAVKDILDRCGYKPTDEVNVNVSVQDIMTRLRSREARFDAENIITD